MNINVNVVVSFLIMRWYALCNADHHRLPVLWTVCIICIISLISDTWLLCSRVLSWFFLVRCKGSMSLYTFSEMLLWFIGMVSLIRPWVTFSDSKLVEIECLWSHEIECTARLIIFPLIAHCWSADQSFSQFSFSFVSNLRLCFQFYSEVSNRFTLHNTPFPPES